MRGRKKYTFYIIILIPVLAAFGSGFLFSDQLARFAYTRLNLAPVALYINRGDAVLSVAIGNYYFNGGAYDLERALRAYQKALDIDPRARLAHYQIARIYFIQGNLINALKEINTEFELHPDNYRAFYVRGLINGYLGRFGMAEKDFSAFIESASSEWAGYNDLAWVQIKLGKFKEAKSTVERAFERIPGEKLRNPWLWISLGIAYLNLKEYYEAKDAFLTALKMTERMSAKYFWSAYPGNNPRHAQESFDQFRASLYFNLGLSYKNIGAYDEAKKAFQNYLVLMPSGLRPGDGALKEEVKALLNSL